MLTINDLIRELSVARELHGNMPIRVEGATIGKKSFVVTLSTFNVRDIDVVDEGDNGDEQLAFYIEFDFDNPVNVIVG